MDVRKGRETPQAPLDPRDAEISRLKRELALLREREGTAHDKAQDARKHFADLTSMSKRFAHSMRATVGERQQQRRRLAAQYAVSQVLAEARNLEEAAPRIYEILGERLGWQAGALWRVDEGSGPPVLRRAGFWRSGDSPAGALLEEAGEGMALRRGEGLPGRVWERGEPVWVEDVLADGNMVRKAATVEDGLRGALAFPIVDGGFVGVFEFFRPEVVPPDEDLMRTAALVGGQISHFLERRQAERERDLALVREREAREHATRILESINDAFFALDEERRFTYVNSRAEALWGKTREELLGKSVREAFPGAVDAETHQAIERALREGEVVEYETVSSLVGTWVSVRVYPSGEGVSVLFHSIEERKKAEEAVRRSEARLSAIVSQAAVGLSEISLEGSFVTVNDELCELLGRPREELLGAGISGVTHPEDLPRSLAAFERLVETGGQASVDKRYLRPDGTVVWATSVLTRLDDEAGRPQRVLAVTVDLTERKLAEEALRGSEERYRSLAEATSFIVWTGDSRGAVVEEIPAWEEFTGQTNPEYEGFGWLKALHPEDRPPDNLWEELSSSNPEPMEEEYRLRHRGGEYRRVAFRGVPILDGRGETREWVGTIFDVEDNRRAEEERERLRREAEAERARLQAVLQQMPGGVMIADRSGRFVLANEGAERIYGERLRFVEECGRRALSYPGGEALPREEWPLVRALRGESVSGMEHYVVRTDGTRAIVRGNCAPVRDREGNIVAAVKAFDDVTERVLAERERDLSREREREAQAIAEEAERRLAFYAGAREERQIISRELHDRVAHSIAVVRQNLELYEVLRNRAPEAAAAKMKIAKEEATATLKSTRDLSMMLRRSEVEEGVAKALAGLGETAVPMGVGYESAVTGDESLIPPHVGNQVFLVLREAVRNAVNHSGCGRVVVRLEITEERVIGTVEDDGRGFEPDEARAGGGLRSMEERTQLVGGTFGLRSVPDGGTRVELSVPLGRDGR